jgi:hypothetical protein
LHRLVKPAKEIVTIDKRFDISKKNKKQAGMTFACDAPFIRGCISISAKR